MFYYELFFHAVKQLKFKTAESKTHSLFSIIEVNVHYTIPQTEKVFAYNLRKKRTKIVQYNDELSFFLFYFI